MKRIAVVLFNLGGPDCLEAVEPFLFNLFSDPAIISLPGVVRQPLARLIARRRAKVARSIYSRMGGRSPLLEGTKAQAVALEKRLQSSIADANVRVFIAMRYWHPLTEEAVAAVAAFAPEVVVLLPLYPQYSTTTTGSSLKEWDHVATARGLRAEHYAVCCYPTQPGFVAAVTDLLIKRLREVPPGYRTRILFSAHGLPKRVVARGDPYPWQVEATVGAVMERLGRDAPDHVICYQSRVGPLEWIGPATEAEIARAGSDGVAAVVVPIAFVSEHSETLVELDEEYREWAVANQVPAYLRVATVADHPDFIEGLAEIVFGTLERRSAVATAQGGRLCPLSATRCGCVAKSKQRRSLKYRDQQWTSISG